MRWINAKPETILKLTNLAQVKQRAAHELCIPIVLTDRSESWLWFPGVGLGETAHRWVRGTDGTVQGTFVEADRSDFHRLWKRLFSSPTHPQAYLCCGEDSYLSLPVEYEATLIPGFGRDWVPADGTGSTPRFRIRASGRKMVTVAPEDALLTWWTAFRIARRTRPQDFLQALGQALWRARGGRPLREPARPARAPMSKSLMAEWLAEPRQPLEEWVREVLALPDDAFKKRDWSCLDGEEVPDRMQ
jgi:hypothetical protein